MASILSGLLKRVIKVRVEGPIGQRLTDKITDDFRKAKLFTPQAVVVVINSIGGSLSQAKHISDILKNYGARHNVPIYCFAEDQCMGSANVILTSGVKAYANEMTLMGDFNYQWSSLWFKKFADKYKIKVDYVYSGENKVKFNPFEEIKPESEKWMQNHLYLLEHQLKCTVINNRQRALTKKQMDKKEIEQKLFNSAIIQPQKAVECGLIDGIMNVDEIMNSTLSGTRVYDVNKNDKFNLRKLLGYAQLAE